MLQIFLENLRQSPSFTYRDEHIARNDTEGYCMVMCLADLADQADRIIDREIEHFTDLGLDFEWCLYSSDLPTDIKDRLEARGFEIKSKEVICMIDVENLPSPPHRSHRVERIQTDQHLADFRLVAEEVFKKDFAFTTGVLAKAIEVGSMIETGFVAYDGQTPVSIGRLFRRDQSPCGTLYTGATREPWRGKGYYQAVIQARGEFARKTGIKYLSVDALPTSLPILLRLGFEPIVESWPCIWHSEK